VSLCDRFLPFLPVGILARKRDQCPVTRSDESDWQASVPIHCRTSKSLIYAKIRICSQDVSENESIHLWSNQLQEDLWRNGSAFDSSHRAIKRLSVGLIRFLSLKQHLTISQVQIGWGSKSLFSQIRNYFYLLNVQRSFRQYPLYLSSGRTDRFPKTHVMLCFQAPRPTLGIRAARRSREVRFFSWTSFAEDTLWSSTSNSGFDRPMSSVRVRHPVLPEG